MSLCHIKGFGTTGGRIHTEDLQYDGSGHGMEAEMVEINDGAVRQFRQVLSIPLAAKATVRLFVFTGCCFSYYGIGTTKSGREGDLLVEQDDMKIYVDPAVLGGLSTASLDYADGMLIISDQGRPVSAGHLTRIETPE